MANWIKKYKWLILLALLALPFILNYVLNCDCGFATIGAPKDWLMFWGSYISSIVTAIMAYIAYRSLMLNVDTTRASIVFRVIADSDYYFLEISNVGAAIAKNIVLNFNEDFKSKLSNTEKESYEAIEKCGITLKNNESKYLGIVCATPNKEWSLNNRAGGTEKYTMSQKDLSELLNHDIHITGSFSSNGVKYKIDDKFQIADFNMNFFVKLNR